MPVCKNIIFVLFSVILLCSCSANKSAPVAPQSNSDNTRSFDYSEYPNDVDRTYLGSWSIKFDLENSTANIEPDRTLKAHFNVTSYIPTPGIVVNSYNPATEIIDVDVTITNSFALNGHDLRLIIFTDGIGHKLINSDSWTGLYDIPGGLPINPFIAYAKTEPGRIFSGYAQHTEDLQIKLPGGNPSVSFAIDASYPGNCNEPYEISGFSQGNLMDDPGSSTFLDVTVLDWQSDVDSVMLQCSEITGVPQVPFHQQNPDDWNLELLNNTGAPAGDYTAYLSATSSQSSLTLYDVVTIIVSTTATFDVTPFSKVYVTDTSFSNIIFTPNGFTPWLPQVAHYGLEAMAVGGQYIYAIFYATGLIGDGVYLSRSSDNGDTWDDYNLVHPLTTGWEFSGAAIDVVGTEVFISIGETMETPESENLFFAYNNNNGAGAFTEYLLSTESGSHSTTIAVDPVDTNNIYVGAAKVLHSFSAHCYEFYVYHSNSGPGGAFSEQIFDT